MGHDQIPPKSKPARSEYLQPLVIALLASVFGFSYSLYYYGNFGRAVALAAIEFLALFWIVLRGNKLIAKREKPIDVADSGKTPSSYPQH